MNLRNIGGISMKYYYVVYECRNDSAGKWIKNAKGFLFEKDLDIGLMGDTLREEEKVKSLIILNYIEMTKKEYDSIREEL